MKYFISIILIIISFIKLEAQQLRVLYFNDAHELEAVDFEGQKVGGISKVSALIKERRDVNTLVLFGGDLAGGTLGGKVFKGSVMLKALNEIGIDVANPGQHEFDYGLDNFLKLKNSSTFPWISANLIDDKNENLLNPFKIIKSGTWNIGILGITDKIETSSPDLALKSNDYTHASKKIIAENPQVDYWIAVTQMDMKKNQILHQAIPEINLILTEETAHDRSQIIWHEHTPIIAASGNAGDVVEVNVNNAKMELQIHPIREGAKEDNQMQSWVSDSLQVMNKRLSTQIGFAKEDFSKQETHFGERAIGNLVTDAFKDYYKADIAIIHGGGIREGIKKGGISLKNVYQILPFENDLVLVKITGSQIQEILHQSIKRMMPQVSGLALKVQKNDDGTSNLQVLFHDQPMDLNQTYLVSLPSYIADGGGDYNTIKPSHIIKREVKDAEALKLYLLKNQIVTPHLEGRIQF
ncbi:MAG: bifunctional metallophosphatase/5'-nucleotidase [Weeksellaceae bacterium]